MERSQTTQDSEMPDFWAKVAEKLRETLQFASADEVVALCKRLLKYGQLSSNDLLENLEKIRFVQDCDRVAQYLHRKTPVEVQHQIRDHYWREYAAYIKRVVRLQLTHYHGKREAEVSLAEAQAFVADKIFREESFRNLVAQYKPQKGKTFEGFIRKPISERAIDASKQHRMPKGDDGVVNPGALAQPVLGKIRGQDGATLRQALDECLDQLGQRANSRDKNLGIQERAAFELQYKAYLHPTDMSHKTLGLVKSKSGYTVEQLKEEFHSALREIKELETIKLAEAEHRRDRTLAVMHERKLELELFGYSVGQLDWLREEALQRKIDGDMENELKVLKKGSSSSKRLKELDFMIGYRRYHIAMKGLEKARVYYQKSLKRPEKYIGKLIGVSQATVARRLKSAKEFLQKCLEAKGIQG